MRKAMVSPVRDMIIPSGLSTPKRDELIGIITLVLCVEWDVVA
jgi:hypothetical protein